jgi:hypothetical protein
MAASGEHGGPRTGRQERARGGVGVAEPEEVGRGQASELGDAGELQSAQARSLALKQSGEVDERRGHAWPKQTVARRRSCGCVGVFGDEEIKQREVKEQRCLGTWTRGVCAVELKRARKREGGVGRRRRDRVGRSSLRDSMHGRECRVAAAVGSR